MIQISILKLLSLCPCVFIKSDAAHAASEWQCSGHVLVHLARVHSHTAPCFDFFKWNDRPHLTRQDMYYIQHGPVQTGVIRCHPSPLWTALFFIPFTLSHLFSSLLSGSQLWLCRGQFPFISIHVRKMNCNSIGPTNPSWQVNSCWVCFSQIRWKIGHWGVIIWVVCNANQCVPQIKYWFLEGLELSHPFCLSFR